MDIKTPIMYKSSHWFTACYGSDLHPDKKQSRIQEALLKLTAFTHRVRRS